MNSCVAVFTARSPNRILQEGGSQAWALNATRARKSAYLVCFQNQHHPDRDFSDATENHGCAFLIGKISDVIPSPERPDRWLIQISEFSRYTIMNSWGGWRNPVRYTTLDAFRIDPAELRFHPVAPFQAELGGPPSHHKPVLDDAGEATTLPLSINDAKAGLALYYGVPPEGIDITIRA